MIDVYIKPSTSAVIKRRRESLVRLAPCTMLRVLVRLAILVFVTFAQASQRLAFCLGVAACVDGVQSNVMCYAVH